MRLSRRPSPARASFLLKRCLWLWLGAILSGDAFHSPIAFTASAPAATCAEGEIAVTSTSFIAAGVAPQDQAVVRPGSLLCVSRSRETIDTTHTDAPQFVARPLELPGVTLAVTRAQIEELPGRVTLPARAPAPPTEPPPPRPIRVPGPHGEVSACGGSVSFDFGHLLPAALPDVPEGANDHEKPTNERPPLGPLVLRPPFVLRPTPAETAAPAVTPAPTEPALAGAIAVGVTTPSTATTTPTVSNTTVSQSGPVLGSSATQALRAAIAPTQEVERVDRQVGFLDSVLTAKRGVEEAARRDEQTLSAPYREMNLPQLKSALAQAEKALTDEAETLAQAQEGLLHGDLARFQRVYANARDKASAGQALIQEELNAQDPTLAVSLLPALFQKTGGSLSDFNPLGATQKLAELFGFGGVGPTEKTSAARVAPNEGTANSAEKLVNRIVLLNGLPEQKRRSITSQLSLAEPTQLKLANGNLANLTILHNGYLMGGGKTGLDCSSLVSATLPEEVRSSRLTTLDLRSIWVYRWTGRMPAPPRYELEQSKKLKTVASAFDAVDIYSGSPAQPGDLLIYRTLWQSTGHVFIVRNFDAGNLSATVLEAAQSGAGTIRERDFPLSMDPPSRKSRQLRAGLYLLRLRPTRQTVCRYDSRRSGKEGASSFAPAAGTFPPQDAGTGAAR